MKNRRVCRLSKKSRVCKFHALFFDSKVYLGFFFVTILVFGQPVWILLFTFIFIVMACNSVSVANGGKIISAVVNPTHVITGAIGDI